MQPSRGRCADPRVIGNNSRGNGEDPAPRASGERKLRLEDPCEIEPFVVPASAVCLTTLEAGCRSSEQTDALDRGCAGGALVDKAADHFASGQWQVMATGLVFHAQVCAGLAPFWAVGRNAPPAAPVVGDKVGEFVQ